ncbi:MAG TPA: thiamine pyrophosphate-dependent enzyme, partial [Conexibacter sp.]|nr:thiamine pyrophosphate-dependent enzyme [Conexibacter sp.]
VTLPLVKHSWQVRDVAELAGVVRTAFAVAREGRPGPVLVDVPRDVQEALVDAEDAAAPAAALPGWDPPTAVDADAVAAVARAVGAAERPVLYVGGGTVNADACAELLALAEAAQIPVVTTLMAKGAIPESHPLSFGCPGMHGGRWANLAIHEADLLIAVGARFDDRVTGTLSTFAPGATVAHYDVDRYELHKVRRAELPVLGPLRPALAQTRALLDGEPRTGAWLAQLRAWRARHPLRYDERAATLKPQRVLERVVAAVRDRDDVVWSTGVGQHQMWAMQCLPCERPRSFLTSGGHGTMGFGVPAAIGAAAARPGATVVCVDGDGSFQMTAQELAAAVAEELRVLVVILNNGGLGMVHQWQTMFYEQRLSHVDLSEPTDCALVARGFGAAGFTVRDEAQLDAALEQALACGRAAVLDVHVDPHERCYPMIAPGAAAVDMLEWQCDD